MPVHRRRLLGQDVIIPEGPLCIHEGFDLFLVPVQLEDTQLAVVLQRSQVRFLRAGDSQIVNHLPVPLFWVLSAAELLDCPEAGCGLDLQYRVLADNLTVDVGAGPRVIRIHKSEVHALYLLPGLFHEELGNKVFQIGADAGTDIALKLRCLAGLLSPHGKRAVVRVQADDGPGVAAADISFADLQPFFVAAIGNHLQAPVADGVSLGCCCHFFSFLLQ